jgi:2-keto-3-deoxy-galactonokinase
MVDFAVFAERMGFLITGAMAGYVAGHYLGFLLGTKTEKLRTDHIFDVAFLVVTSGALKKVYRRITGYYSTDNELRQALFDECEIRAKQRNRWST